MPGTIDIGTLSGTIQYNLDQSGIADAIAALGKIGDSLSTTGERAKTSGNTAEAAYRKLAASLDPAVAAQQKLERATQTLDAALGKGLITQDQYSAALARAQEKFSSTEQSTTSLRAKLDELAHSVDAFGGHLNELGEKFESVKSFGEGLKEKLLELAAVVGAGLSLEKIIEDTVASQDAQAQLAAGLKATGAATGETREKLEALTTTLAGTTRFSRTTIESAESLGLTFTHISADAFPRFLQSAADIAARTGESLPAAVEKLGRALDTGMVTSLKRAGITFDQTAQAQAKFFADTGQYSKEIALVLGQVEGKLAGSAAAARDTLGGALQLLRNEFEEIAIKIGTALTPALKALAENLGDGAKLSGGLAESLGNILASAIRVLDGVLTFARDHSDLLKAALAAIITYETIGLFVSLKEAIIAAAEAEGLLAALNPFALAIAGAAALIVWINSVNAAVREAQKQFDAELEGDRLLATLRTATAALTDAENAHALQVIETNKQYAAQLEIQLKIADAAVDAERKSISFLQDFKDGWRSIKNLFSGSGGFFGGILSQQQAPLQHEESAAEQKAHFIQDTLSSVNKTIEESEAKLKSLGKTTDKTSTDAAHFAEHFNSAAQAVQAYADKIFDLTNKLLDNGANQSKLLSALGRGEIAYNLQRAAIERSNAIETTTREIEKDHREELEKLRSEIDKAAAALTQKHGVDQAATAAIRDGNAALAEATRNYESTKTSLANLAAKNVDLAQAEKVRLAGLQDTRAFSQAVAGDYARLEDAITGTSAATRAHATDLDVERTLLAYSAKGIADLDGSIAENVRQRHAQLNSLLDVIDAQKSLTGLEQKGAVAVAISGLDSAATNELRALGEKYIDFVANLGHGSLDEGNRLLHAWADAAGLDFKAVTDAIKANLQQLADAALAKKITAGGETLFTAYQQERADIERLMAASTDRVHVTVADGLKELARLQTQYIDTQLSAWGSLFDTLSQEFGGVFTDLARFVKILQEIQTIRADLTTIYSGLTSTFSGAADTTGATGLVTAAASLDTSAAALTAAGASQDGSSVLLDGAAEALAYAAGVLTSVGVDWGGTITLSATEAETSWTAIQASATALDGSAAALNGAAASLESSSVASGAGGAAGGAGGGGGGAAGGLAVVAAFVAAYFVGSQILNIRDRHAFGSPGAYQIVNGQGIESGQTAIAEAIKKVVKDFETLAGVTVTSLDSIGIKVQNSGKEFRAYVGDQLIGTFSSLQEAVGVALQRAFSTAKFSGIVDPAIAELLTGAQANSSLDFTQLAANIKIVTDAIAQNLPKVVSDLRKLGTDFDTSVASELSLFLTHASAGFKELFGLNLQAFVTGVNAVRDSITGQTHSAFLLFEQQRQAFNAEQDAHRLSLLAQIADTKAKLLAAGVTIAAIQQIMGAVNAAQSGLKALSADAVAGGFGGTGGSIGPDGIARFGGGGGNPGIRPPGGGGTGGPTGSAGGQTIPGQKEDATADLKALLAELVKELGALPADIKSEEFSGNANAVEYFANQLARTDSDFGKLIADLAASGQSADKFGSTLKADLANLTLALEDQRRAITGDTLSAKEQLEIRKRQAIAWNAQLALDEAALQLQILKQEADIAAAIASRALAQAAIDNAKAMGDAAALLAATTAAAGGITDAQLLAMQQNLAALQGVLDALKNEKPIDPNSLKASGGGKNTANSGQTPAEQLAAIFDTFYKSLLPQLSQQIADINKKWDDALKLTGKNSEAIGRINSARATEIALLEKQAREAAIANVNSFLATGGPQLTQQIEGIRTAADGLVAGLRDLNKQGALSTAQLHSLVGAIRAAEQAQIDAVKNSFTASLGAFSDSLSNTGLIGQLQGIASQAVALHDSLNQLAAAGALTAEEFYKDAQKIIDAARAQDQAAISNAANSLLGELYGYLKDSADADQLKYTLTIASLEVQRNQLALAGYAAAQLAIIDGLIAKVVAGGPALFASGSPAATGPNPANALADAAAQQSSAAGSLQSAADAFAAAISKLTDYENSLFTNPTLSALTPAQQLAAARDQLQTDYSSALGGNVDAVNRFQTLSDTFLQLAHAQDPTRSSYGVDFQQVIDELNNLRSLTGVVGVPGPTNTTGLLGTPSAVSTTTSATSATQAFLNLDPVVSSIGSASARNHDDLIGLQTQVLSLTSAVRSQQASLDRVVSYLSHP